MSPSVPRYNGIMVEIIFHKLENLRLFNLIFRTQPYSVNK